MMQDSDGCIIKPEKVPNSTAKYLQAGDECNHGFSVDERCFIEIKN